MAGFVVGFGDGHLAAALVDLLQGLVDQAFAAQRRAAGRADGYRPIGLFDFCLGEQGAEIRQGLAVAAQDQAT